MLGLADFAGEWTVARRIADRHGAQSGRFDGVATLTPQADALAYLERGTLHLGPAATFHAERRYLWRFEAGTVAMAFADGRPFHRFVPEGRAAGTDHPCGADLYRVAYDFTGWPAWESRWRVTGPAKDYEMVTLYTR